MTNSDLHLVIAVREGVASLAHPDPLDWDQAQKLWLDLDDARLTVKPRLAPSQLYYIVRSLDDPTYSKIAPRLYVGREAAAKALARAMFPGQSSRNQHWQLAEKLGVRLTGWWRTASAAQRSGLIGVIGDGRAYITSTGRRVAQNEAQARA